MVLDPFITEQKDICPVCGVSLVFGVTTKYSNDKKSEVCCHCDSVLG